MVAAAKVRRAESKVKASRPFSNELVKSFQRLLATNPDVQSGNVQSSKALDNYPALLSRRELKSVGLLIVSSDRGLAGAYNANVVRKAVARAKELEKDGINTKFFVVGLKGVSALKRAHVDITETYVRMPAVPTIGEANVIAEDLSEYYIKGDIDRIEIITTHFKSMLSFEVQLWQLLPVLIPVESLNEEETRIRSEMIFEPSPEAVLQKIVPLYVTNRIYQALIEASASELAARMSAMASATTNAGDMIRHLTIVYNKARQAAITQEILEVVSGAEAL